MNYKIGFDAQRLITNFTGFGTYSRTLVRHLCQFFPTNHYLLFTREVKSNPAVQALVETDSVDLVSPSTLRKFFWRSAGMRREAINLELEIFHGLVNDLPHAIQSAQIPKVVTVHDLVYRHFPDVYSPRTIRRKDQALARACQAATRIIAISESTKTDLIEFFSISSEKISVIHPSCDERYQIPRSDLDINRVRKYHSLPPRYLLYVGSITKRKNLLLLCKALRMIPVSQRLPLVVVGKSTGYTEEVHRYLHENDLTDWVFFLQIKGNDDLPYIYQGADCFIYPSRYEGFGLPVIEAMFSGTPVITSRNSSLIEAGGDAAVFIDPDQADELAEALLSIQNSRSLHSELREKGLKHAGSFSPEMTSTRLMSVYENLLRQPTLDSSV